MMDSPQFYLRSLEQKDLPTIASFEREIAKISFPDDPITDLNFYIDKMKRLIGDNNVAAFVVDAGGEAVGWAYASRRQNFITKKAYGDFHSIYISPTFRGTGVSKALMNAVFDFCKRRGLDRVVFRTRSTNEPMKAVLARSGFVPTQIYYEKELGEGAAGLAEE
jgi:RimJ/RimL family protein N-acetyltransferase